MNIHSKYTDKCSYPSFKALPANYKKIPEIIGTAGKYVGEYIGMPEQKLVLATTALLFQPLMDLKFAEEDKKVDSAIKSASKAIAGGITGVPIRAGFIALANHFISPKKIAKNFDEDDVKNFANFIQQSLFPRKNEELRLKNVSLANYNLAQYNKTLGTLAAIIFMLAFSNSKMDVPLTSDIQDLLTKVIKEKKPWSKSFAEVAIERNKKILKWIDKKKEFFKNIIDKTKKINAIILENPSKPKETGGK